MKRHLYHKPLPADKLVLEEVLSKQDTFLGTRLKFYFEYMVKLGRFKENGVVSGVFLGWGFLLLGWLVWDFCCYCFGLIVVAIPFKFFLIVFVIF